MNQITNLMGCFGPGRHKVIFLPEAKILFFSFHIFRFITTCTIFHLLLYRGNFTSQIIRENLFLPFKICLNSDRVIKTDIRKVIFLPRWQLWGQKISIKVRDLRYLQIALYIRFYYHNYILYYYTTSILLYY